MDQSDAAGLADRLRLVVNGILEQFNRDNITPKEAGLVILALTHRLMTALKDAPDQRRLFIMDFINLVNSFLAGDLEED